MTDSAKTCLAPYLFAPKSLGIMSLSIAAHIAYCENAARDSVDAEGKLRTWQKTYDINSKLVSGITAIAAAMGAFAYKKSQ